MQLFSSHTAPKGNEPTDARYWKWPNMLGLDAVLIAVLWQCALASALDLSLGGAVPLVLGLSVWLSYSADRLFDVARREPRNLLSLRHRFAKRHRVRLWRIWAGVLVVNLIAATQLNPDQLKNAAWLLTICLAYTVLNQKFERRFFPKELCVALIFSWGVIVFLPGPVPLGFVALFAYLCLVNCLIIGAKESKVDAHLRVRSMASILPHPYPGIFIVPGAVTVLVIETPLEAALLFSFAGLGTVYCLRKYIHVETYRVLADAVLLVGPLIGFFFTKTPNL